MYACEENKRKDPNMGSFILNDFGEVMLELNTKLITCIDMRVEVDERKNEATLKSKEQDIVIGYIHPELIFSLKQNRYLFVVEGNKSFYARRGQLAKVVFC